MNENSLQIIENWIAKERAMRAEMQKARQTGNTLGARVALEVAVKAQGEVMDLLKKEWGMSLGVD